MILVIVGGLLAALGLLAGALLVAAPLGWLAATAGWTLWLLFPLFTGLGYALLAVGTREPTAKVPTLLLSLPLVLLALACAVALVVIGAGLLRQPDVSTAPLWYVLVLAGLMGGLGAAASSRRSGA